MISIKAVLRTGAVLGVLLVLFSDCILGAPFSIGWVQVIAATTICVVAMLIEKLPLYVSAFVAFGMILGILCGELTLRLPYFESFLCSIFEPDTKRIFRYVSNWTKRIVVDSPGGSETILVQTNSIGIRNPEISRQKAGYRIAVFGDSFIAAEQIRSDRTFSAELQSVLQTNLSKPIEVVNAGVSAYGPDQALLLMEETLSTINPDLVIFSLYAGNDGGDLLSNRIFSVGPEGSLIQNSPQLEPELLWHLRCNRICPRVFLLLSRQVWPFFFERFILKEPLRPGTDENGIQAQLDQAEADYKKAVSDGDPIVTRILNPTQDVDLTFEPGSRSAELKQKLLQLTLRRAKEFLTSHGVGMIVMIVPAPTEVIPEHPFSAWKEIERRGMAVDGRVGIYQKIAELEGLPVINLRNRFLEQNPSTLYFAEDIHLTEAGHRVAAEYVAEVLKDSPWLSKQSGAIK